MFRYVIRNQRKRALAILIYCFFFSFFSAASVSVLMPFVNFIFAGQDIAAFFNLQISLPADQYTGLIFLCLITWILFFLKNLFFAAAQNKVSRFKNNLLQQLREDYLERSLSQKISYFHALQSGHLVHRMFDATRQFSEKLSLGYYDVTRTVPLILMYSAILLAISWKLTLFSLLIIPLISLAGNRLHKTLNRSITEEQAVMGRLVQQIQQKFYAIKLVKLFHSENIELEDFHKKNLELKNILHARERLESAGTAALEMIGVSAGVFLLYVVGTETLEGRFRLGPGGFVLFIAAVFSMIDPMRNLIRAVQTLKESAILLKTLQQPERVPAKTFSYSITCFEQEIAFNQASFRFPERTEPIFRDLNLTICKGEKIALEGRSGIGKSTLIDLLLGLYEPHSGLVTMDGKPLSEIDRRDISKIFGVATQEAFLFHDSIRNNLMYHTAGLSDAELIHALGEVGLSEWYRRLPQGLNTLIGERGHTMSGGEKQKLVLARMILRNPDVLIFDEATSALDLPSEKEIFELIEKLFPDKTMILISHRPTLRNLAGRIIEIVDDTIREKNVSSTFS